MVQILAYNNLQRDGKADCLADYERIKKTGLDVEVVNEITLAIKSKIYVKTMVSELNCLSLSMVEKGVVTNFLIRENKAHFFASIGDAIPYCSNEEYMELTYDLAMDFVEYGYSYVTGHIASDSVTDYLKPTMEAILVLFEISGKAVA